MSGKNRQETNTQGDWAPWLKPEVQKFAGSYGNLIYSGPNGELRPYDPSLDQRVAGFDPSQEAGLRGITDVAGGQGADYATLLKQAQATARGDYLDPEKNPYLKATYENAARGLTDEYQTSTAPGLTAEALRSGAFGSSAAQEYADKARYGLGSNLAGLATDIYGGNYAQERQNQLATQQAMPGLLQAQYSPYEAMLAAGGQRQQQQQSEYDVATRNAQAKDNYQLGLLEAAGNAWNTFLGPGATQHQYTSGRNPMLSSFSK